MKRIAYLLIFLFPVFGFSQLSSSKTEPASADNSEYTFWLKLNLFLEGPIKETFMKTDLNKEGQIPLAQPYNIPPWNYDGPESVDTIPNGNIVDWVYLEIRNATGPGQAADTTAFGWKAAFLTNTGQVVDLDGTSMLQFDTTYT
jgi:hypothetical protein